MTSCVSKLKATPSFCFPFEIPDDPTASTIQSKKVVMFSSGNFLNHIYLSNSFQTCQEDYTHYAQTQFLTYIYIFIYQYLRLTHTVVYQTQKKVRYVSCHCHLRYQLNLGNQHLPIFSCVIYVCQSLTLTQFMCKLAFHQNHLIFDLPTVSVVVMYDF